MEEKTLSEISFTLHIVSKGPFQGKSMEVYSNSALPVPSNDQNCVQSASCSNGGEASQVNTNSQHDCTKEIVPKKVKERRSQLRNTTVIIECTDVVQRTHLKHVATGLGAQVCKNIRKARSYDYCVWVDGRMRRLQQIEEKEEIIIVSSKWLTDPNIIKNRMTALQNPSEKHISGRIKGLILTKEPENPKRDASAKAPSPSSALLLGNPKEEPASPTETHTIEIIMGDDENTKETAPLNKVVSKTNEENSKGSHKRKHSDDPKNNNSIEQNRVSKRPRTGDSIDVCAVMKNQGEKIVELRGLVGQLMVRVSILESKLVKQILAEKHGANAILLV